MGSWADELTAVAERIGRRFARRLRRGAVGYVRELLSGVERKNGWQLVEHLGHPTPTESSTRSPEPTGTPTPSGMT